MFDSPGDPVVPGLRAGRALLGSADVRFERDVYVPGVRLDGRLTANHARFSGTLRVAGTLRGTLRVVRDRVTGRLGSHRVHARLRVTRGHLIATAAARAAAVTAERRAAFPRPR